MHAASPATIAPDASPPNDVPGLTTRAEARGHRVPTDSALVVEIEFRGIEHAPEDVFVDGRVFDLFAHELSEGGHLVGKACG